MSRTVTLADLRTRARELADQEQDTAQFIEDAELTEYINASLGMWHTMVAQADPERFGAEETITATGATGYNLPADYLATLSLEYKYSDQWYIPLTRSSVSEERYYRETTTDRALAYRLWAGTVVLMPSPASGTYRHRYVTHAPVLSSDGDTVDGVNGWESWIYYDAAIKMMLKEESDASFLIAERNRIQRDIEKAASDRDYANPGRVIDVRDDRRYHNWDDWWWYSG